MQVFLPIFGTAYTLVYTWLRVYGQILSVKSFYAVGGSFLLCAPDHRYSSVYILLSIVSVYWEMSRGYVYLELRRTLRYGDNATRPGGYKIAPVVRLGWLAPARQ